jgi:hypothetical protein
MTEVAWAYKPLFLYLLRKHKPSLHKYLPPEVREATDALPETLTVYRGCARAHIEGLAWTTDPATAEFFAVKNRWAGVAPDRVIATATIQKAGVFYATDQRNEAEIILDPDTLRGISVRGIARQP